MTTIQQTSVFNVEATINAQVRAALTAVTRPAWLPAMPAIRSNVPETSANMPAFSLHHIPVSNYDRWQGRGVGNSQKGVLSVAILEVSCWVTREDRDWQAQLRTMQDMALTVLTNNGRFVIRDYAADRATPDDTSYLVRFGDVSLAATSPDINPDVERRRLLAEYEWIYRS